MQIIRGDYDTKYFVRKDRQGNVITSIPEKIYFTVKNDIHSDEVLIQKRLNEGITVDEDFVYKIEFNASDTDNLAFGKYVYDIEIKNGDKPKTIQIGTLEITNEVTTAKDEV